MFTLFLISWKSMKTLSPRRSKFWSGTKCFRWRRCSGSSTPWRRSSPRSRPSAASASPRPNRPSATARRHCRHRHHRLPRRRHHRLPRRRRRSSSSATSTASSTTCCTSSTWSELRRPKTRFSSMGISLTEENFRSKSSSLYSCKTNVVYREIILSIYIVYSVDQNLSMFVPPTIYLSCATHHLSIFAQPTI